MNIYDYLPTISLCNTIPPYGIVTKVKTYRVEITNPGKYRWRAYFHIDIKNNLIIRTNYDKNRYTCKPTVNKVYTYSFYDERFIE